MREMRYFGLDDISDSESDVQRPPPSEKQRASRMDEVMRRVAVKMARTLLLWVDLPPAGSKYTNTEISGLKSLLDSICDWVGPEAAEIKRFSSSGDKILMLLGEVRNEMQILLQESGPFFCRLERAQRGGSTNVAITINRI
mmetsp:Transcript_41907/g.118824  ORF Transcript_41907/g.118824 Transcript_41907/m.118824 type:complete len:141 (+) Transcript_41907:155-577(+)